MASCASQQAHLTVRPPHNDNVIAIGATIATVPATAMAISNPDRFEANS